MKLYKSRNGYWLIPDIIKDNMNKAGIRFKNGKFSMNYYWELDNVKEVPLHEYLFDNSPRTNIIFRMHKILTNNLKGQKYVGTHTKTTLLFVVYEFENTFKDILQKFNVNFLTIENDKKDR